MTRLLKTVMNYSESTIQHKLEPKNKIRDNTFMRRFDISLRALKKYG